MSAEWLLEEKEKDNYPFVLDTKNSDGPSGGNGLCWGVQLKNVLIDLGATCNIVDSATW